MSFYFSICQNCKAIFKISDPHWDQLCPKCKSKKIIFNEENDKLVINCISASATAELWESQLNSITKIDLNYSQVPKLQHISSNRIVSLIDIKNNRYIDSRYILSIVSLKIGDIFNQETIKQDIKSVFDLGYFSKVWVDTSTKGSSIEIFYSVEENPILNNINIKGDSKISSSFIKQKMFLSPGKIINWKHFQDDLNSIYKIHSDLGFLCAGIEDLKLVDGELSFSITLAKIENIRISEFNILDQLENLNFNLPRIFDYYELKEFLLKIYLMYNLKEIHFNLNPGHSKDSFILDLFTK